MNELFKISAVQAVNLLKSGEIRPLDLIEEAIARIEKVMRESMPYQYDVLNVYDTKQLRLK